MEKLKCLNKAKIVKEGLTVQKKKVLTFLTITLLIIASFYAGHSLASPSNTFTISSGIYPSAASYTIYKEGSTYYAKNAYGAIDYSGTNASQIINNCAASTDGIIFLKNGEYLLSNSIVLDSGDSLIGESHIYTILSVSTNIHVIRIEGTAGSPVSQVTVRNLRLKSTASRTATVSNGINCNYAELCTFEYLDFEGIPDDAINLDYSSHLNQLLHLRSFNPSNHSKGTNFYIHRGSEKNIVFDIYTEYGAESGIVLDNANETKVEMFYVYSPNWLGVTVENSKDVVVSSGTVVYVQTYSAYQIDNSANVRFSNLKAYSSKETNLRMNNAIDCQITNCNFDTTTLYSNILIMGTSQNNELSNMRLRGAAEYGIQEKDSSDLNIIALINARDNTLGGIKKVGVSTKVNLCWNGTSWIP